MSNSKTVILPSEAKTVILATRSGTVVLPNSSKTAVLPSEPKTAVLATKAAPAILPILHGSGGGNMHKSEYDPIIDANKADVRHVTIEIPTGTEDIPIFFTPVAIIMNSIHGVVSGTNPSATINPVHSPDRSSVGLSMLTAPVAIVNKTVGQTLTDFDDNTIPADSWIRLKTTSVGGTVEQLCVSFAYSLV